jgi:hypothetical protein
MADPIRIPLPDEEVRGAPKRIALDEPVQAKRLDNAPLDSDLSALLKGAGTTGIRGLSLIAGMPGDIQGLADYLVTRARTPLSAPGAAANVERTKEFRGDAYKRLAEENPTLAKALGYIPSPPTSEEVARPVLERTGEYIPQSDMGRYAMIGGEGAIGMLGPGGLSAGLRAAGRGTEGAVNLAREALKGGVKSAPLGGVANVSGTMAAEFTGDPLAGIAAGTAVPAGLQAGLKAAGNYIAPAVSPELMPNIRQNIADQKLFESAKDPAAALAAAREAEIVPGSKPTFAELTGDQGLLKAQKAAQTVDQSPFNTQQSEQNAARLAELQKMAPTGADIMAPAKLFRDRIESIERAAQETIDLAQKRATEANATIGPGIEPEVTGAKLRELVANTNEQKVKAITALYDAVDPGGKLQVVASSARDAAAKMIAEFDPAVETRSALAAPIVEMVASLPEVMPYSKLIKLDKTITKKMAEAKRVGDSGYGDLVALKGHVMGAIDNAVENQAKWEQAAVARGTLEANETIDARLADALKRQQLDWYEARDNRGASASLDGTGRSTTVPPARGADRPGEGRPRDDAGAPAVSGDVPNVDPEAAQRLTAAKQAHAERAKLYDNGPLASALETTGFKGQYKASDASLLKKAFVPGDAGYSTASTWLKGAGSSPEMVAHMQDVAVLRLREAMKDGLITPQKLDVWKKTYGNALRAIDEAAPGFSSKFDSAATATDALGIAQKAMTNALSNEQKGVAGRFLGASDPSEVVKQVGQMLSAADGPSQLKDLLAVAGTNTDAVQGLRKAGVEYMTDHLTNAGITEQNQAVLSSAKLRDFLSKNEGSLKTLYGEEHLSSMRRVAEDLERSQKAFDAMRVKGGSDTMSNAIAWLKDKGPEASNKLISAAMLWEMGQSLVQGDMMSAFGAAAGATGKHFMDRMRAAGINDARDLYVRGLVDPEVGAAMLERAIDKNGKVNASVLKKLGDAVTTSAARSSYMLAPEEKRERRATGGAIMDHASIANKLIRRAEMAGKTQASTTEPLLAVPDDTVARALEIAGQGF